MKLDIQSTRSAKTYSKKVQVLRVFWGIGHIIFRLTPRPCFGMRRMILRMFGAKIGSKTNIYPSATIYFPWNLEIGKYSSIGEWAYIYNLGLIKIGDRATISQRVHLCAGTHDFRLPNLPLLKPPIVIGDDAWICADAFVGPGVVINSGAVVGACSVAVNDINAWDIVAGNPAKFLGKRELKDETSNS